MRTFTIKGPMGSAVTAAYGGTDINTALSQAEEAVNKAIAALLAK